MVAVLQSSTDDQPGAAPVGSAPSLVQMPTAMGVDMPGRCCSIAAWHVWMV